MYWHTWCIHLSRYLRCSQRVLDGLLLMAFSNSLLRSAFANAFSKFFYLMTFQCMCAQLAQKSSTSNYLDWKTSWCLLEGESNCEEILHTFFLLHSSVKMLCLHISNDISTTAIDHFHYSDQNNPRIVQLVWKISSKHIFRCWEAKFPEFFSFPVTHSGKAIRNSSIFQL